MIKPVVSYDECRDFVADFFDDPSFSDPMLTTDEQLQNNLIRSINQPERHSVLGVYCGESLIGLFAFLVIHDEKYLEMLVGLSREQAAYDEIFQHLEQNFNGFKMDFVFNPNNYLLRKLLISKNAEFETEQQKMKLIEPKLTVDTAEIQPLTEQYYEQYREIHTRDMYWTAEKIIAAPERFRTLVAVREGRVVGYIDVTRCFDENEPFDLVVLPEFRRRGYGKKLLTKAVELNRPSGMMLLVDIDNEPAIRLYQSVGFEKICGQNNLTAHLPSSSSAANTKNF